MIAAAAWRSGTTEPLASVLKRGTVVSRAMRTRAATWAFARASARAFDAFEE